MHYYKFFFIIDGRKYERNYRTEKILTLNEVKEDAEKYMKIRMNLLKELDLLKKYCYKEVELFDITRIDEWKKF